MHDSVSIFGARGFVGSHLVRHYEAQGINVRAYGRGDEARLFSDAHGTVLYCAGFTGDFAADPAATVEAHAGLIGRVIAQATFSRLVYCSSTRLYDSAGVTLADEETPLNLSPNTPRHLYDLSKALGENLCLNDPQKRCVVARISGVFSGEMGAPGFLSQLLQSAQNNTIFALATAPGVKRDYIAIEDTVRALAALAERATAGIYNVASGFETSNAEIAAMLAKTGITLSFENMDAGPSLPQVDVHKLAALGIVPQNPLDVIWKLLHA